MLIGISIQFNLRSCEITDHASSSRLPEVKNNGKFQTISAEYGRGRLQELLAYERFEL